MPPSRPPSSSRVTSATRRRFLGLAGASAVAGLAGCLSGPRSGSPGSDSPSSTDTPDGPAGTGNTAGWAQFGADPHNTGHAPAVSGPGAGDAEVAWRHDAGTPTMNTSPVVADGVVYAAGSGDPGLVHAVDVATGEQRWQFEPAGYVSSAPALAGDTMFVGTWGKEFYAVDTATGDRQWRQGVGHRFGASAPVVADGTVYVGTVGDGPLVVSDPEDEEQFEACAFLALDAATGDIRWQYREFDERDSIDSSPAVADGRVFFAGEQTLYALNAATGEAVWTRSVPISPESSPAVADGVVYYGATVGSTDDDEPPARLRAFEAATGETLWAAPIEDTSLRTSPAVADGTVYVAASSRRVCTEAGGADESNCSGVNRGRLYAVDAASGERLWTAPLTTDTRSSPAVAGGVVYVGSGGGLSAVSTDGDPLWRLDFDSDDRRDSPYVKSSPAVADGTVLVGASDGRLRAVRTA